MKAEAKSAAILVATLTLGVVLGMVLQGLLMRDRARQVAELRTPPGFVSLVEGVIQPRAEQEAGIRAVLEASARRYDSLLSSTRVGVGLVLDSMKLKLAPLLDERQRERLSRMAQLPEPDRPPPRPGERPPDAGSPRDNPPRGGDGAQGNPPRAGRPPQEAPPRDQPPPR